MNEDLLKYFNGDELAASVWLSKYADSNEITPNDMHKRMANEFGRIEREYINKEKGLINMSDIVNQNMSKYYNKRYQEGSHLSEEKIYDLFKDFKYIVPQGSIMSVLGTNTIGSLSNCYVIPSPFDSYGGILKSDQELVQLMKRRAGVGTNLDTLRPGGAIVNNVAKTSTGADSFMDRYSSSTREVAQEGRRGALMLLMSCSHPSVFKFVTKKKDRTKVTGANVSVMFTDEFMQAAQNDKDFICQFPIDYKLSEETKETILKSHEYNVLVPETINGTKIYTMKIKAKELWDLTIEMAWESAEPGVAFKDRINNYSPDGVYYLIDKSNPCGEQWLPDYDSCRLFAINLFSVVRDAFTSEATIDYDLLYSISYEQQRLADDLIDLEVERIKKIIEKIKSDVEPDELKQTELTLWNNVLKICQEGRRTGCGITALADMLAALNLKYDSDEAIAVIKKVMKTKMQAELDCTIDLALLRGTFPIWNKDLEWEQDGHGGFGKNEFYQFIADEFPDQFDRMLKFGRRNISWSTIAPTGSVSILTQTSSGCEPLFQPFYFRKKKINPDSENARVDFVDQNGDKWQEFPVLHQKFIKWYIIQSRCEHCPNIAIEALENANKEDLDKVFKQSPWYKSIANDIDWIKRVEIQAVLQAYTTNAISSTINLPETVTKEEVSRIYNEAWQYGLKGITVYRDNCRTGVLSANSIKNSKFSYKDALKRPKEIDAELHIINMQGHKYTIIVGLIDSKPYEIFGHQFEDDGKSRNGKLVKKKRGEYEFVDSENKFIVSSTMTDEQTAITRLTSTSLRHGTDIKFIVEQLNKCPGDLFSFTKALSRVLKKYIPNGSKSTSVCNECESDQVIFEEGCSKCMSCGNSKCG